MNKFATFVLSAILLVACSATKSADNTPVHMPGVNYGFNQSLDIASHGGSSGQSSSSGGSGGNLIYAGGKLLPSSNTYAIWWGTQASFPSDAKTAVSNLLSGLDGSSYLGNAQQYMSNDASSISTTFQASWTDTSSPSTTTSISKIITACVNEACKAISANGATPDSTAIYFVYTSNYPHNLGFCALHSHGTCNGVDIQIAYMPNTTGVSICDPGNALSCNTLSQGTRSLLNDTAHEFMEAVTDPDVGSNGIGTGWQDSATNEMMDKCVNQFSSCVTLGTNSYQLQEGWSNAVSGCVQ